MTWITSDQETYLHCHAVFAQRRQYLISCSGSIGRVCRVPPGLKLALVRSAAILKPNERIQSPFLEKCLQSRFLQRQIRINTSQLAQGNLFQGAIQRLRVPLPPQSEQDRYVDLVGQLEATEKNLSDHNQHSTRFGVGRC